MPPRFIGGRWVDVPSFEIGPETSASQLSPEDSIVSERLVALYPELEGQIQTTEDLQHILDGLRAEDDRELTGGGNDAA